jgi:hypothetical protein
MENTPYPFKIAFPHFLKKVLIIKVLILCLFKPSAMAWVVNFIVALYGFDELRLAVQNSL